jgi:hypothetical protein
MAGLGVAEPPPGQKGWPANPTGQPPFLAFCSFFLDFFKRKCDGGILGIKKVKLVKLSQFENLEG